VEKIFAYLIVGVLVIVFIAFTASEVVNFRHQWSRQSLSTYNESKPSGTD
jgi:hypothetical protein